MEGGCGSWACSAKTKHNEVAPSQHEMAPIYTNANAACDQNQLVMEMMKKVADRHGLVCLLHEKPFAGVNGSGKHDNWSLSTDTGKNLFKPGSTPRQNAQFLLFLAAFIKGVDDYQEFLRARWLPRQRPPAGRPGGTARRALHLPGRRALRCGGLHHQRHGFPEHRQADAEDRRGLPARYPPG